MAFFVAEFVLIMQFLWKYINDMLGKGVSIGIILEVLFYNAIKLIPEAVPISILIASVMVFGNLAERYELSSMKSAGISLTRIMMGAILISMMTAMFSLFASNYLRPRAEFKLKERMAAIKRQKPALSFEESVFVKDFSNYVIRINDIDKNGRDIQDILIYDHSSMNRNILNVLTAKDGVMYTEDSNDDFIMEMNNGVQYKEMEEKERDKKKHTYPLVRTNFEKWTKIFDMEEFSLEARNLSQSRHDYKMMTGAQLRESIDSFELEIAKNLTKTNYSYNQLLNIEEPKPEKKKKESKLPKSVLTALSEKEKQEKENVTPSKNKFRYRDPHKQSLDKPLGKYNSFIELFAQPEQRKIAKGAKAWSAKKNDLVKQNNVKDQSLKYHQSRFKWKHHQKYSNALICIVFLFIGAPLGSIVRKGGYGYPLLIAIVFFMLFVVLTIMGDKMNFAKSMGPYMAAWLPNIVIIPIAAIFTYKALNDSTFKLFNNIKLYFSEKFGS